MMDHVNNPNMPSLGNQPYSNENLDPNLMDTSNWGTASQYQMPSDPYPVPQNFQQFPSSSNSMPSYPQFTTQQQPAQYTQSPYASYYAPQYSQHTSPYGGSPYSILQAQPQQQQQPTSRPQSQSPFVQNGNYFSPGPQSISVSPSTLQINKVQQERQVNSPINYQQPNLSTTFNTQNWPQNSAQTYKSPFQPVESAPHPQQASSPQPSAKSSLNGNAVPVQIQASSSSTSQPLPKAKPSTLRITDQRFLDSIGPGNSIDLAPYLAFGDQPLEHMITGKTDIPKYKPRKNRSGNALVPGLDIKTAPTSIIKTIARQAKSAAKKLKASQPDAKSSPSKAVQPRIAGLGINTKSAASPSAASTTSSDEDSSSEEDSSESEYEDSMPVETIANVRQAVRPEEASEGAAWDVTGILWLDRHRNATKEEIVTAIPKFQEYITTLRDEVKVATANVTTAETEKKPSSEIKKLTDLRERKRKVLAAALKSATTTGHHHIIENLGSSQKLVMILTNVLNECYKLDDFTGELPKATLALMSKFDGLTDVLLQKLKFETTAKRFTKKGDAEVKENFAKILASTPEGKDRAKKAQEEAVKLERIKNGLAIQERARAREEAAKASATAGSKRAHDGDGSNGKPTKKLASDTTGVAATSKTVPTKNIAPPTRTGGLFASLKKPSTKSQTIPAQAKKLEPPKPATAVPPPPPPPSSKQSSLADLLASINKPKEAPKEPEAPPRPLETNEEKAKRERKESRRHLRVRWKDGSALEEIRLFKHEQAEDEGRQDDMLRDAHDDRSEGMRLKQALEGIEIEDEDDTYGEVCIKARYFEPVAIDFSDLDEESLKRNFTTRGGMATFRTKAQETQERREMMELMAFYTDNSDIPYSPKEPPPSHSEEGARERLFGQPTDAWINQRLQEIHQFGPQQALVIMHNREKERRRREGLDTNSQENTQSLTSHQPDLSSLLDQMHTSKPRNTELGPLHNIIMDSSQIEFLENICKKLNGKPYPPTEAPEWMSTESKKEWYIGYNRDNAKKRAAEEQAAALAYAQQQAELAQQIQLVQAQQAQQAQQYQPQIQVPIIQNPFPPPAPPTTHQYQGYDLSQFQQAYQQDNNQAQQPDWSAYMQAQSHGQTNQHSHKSSVEPAYSAPSFYDDPPSTASPWDDNTGNSTRTSKKNKHKKHRDLDNPNNMNTGNDGTVDKYGRTIRGAAPIATMPPSANEREYKGKKKPCKFWAEGKCAKGTACGFLHD